MNFWSINKIHTKSVFIVSSVVSNRMEADIKSSISVIIPYMVLSSGITLMPITRFSC